MTTNTTTVVVPRLGGYAAKNFLKCPEYLAREHMPNTYPEDLKDPVDDFTLALMDNGNVFEDVIGERLAGIGAHVVCIAELRGPNGERTTEAKLAKEAATLQALLDPQVRVIFNARIGSHFEELLAAARGTEVVLDETRISEPDVLVKLVQDGREFIAPVDIKDHKSIEARKSESTYQISSLTALDSLSYDIRCGVPQRDDFMQLAHYRRHMEAIGLVAKDAPNIGGVIGREEECLWESLTLPLWSDPRAGDRVKHSAMELYDTYFALARELVADARARDLDPTLEATTAPLRATGCKACVWNTSCTQALQQVAAGGHVSLLARVTATGAAGTVSVATLEAAGIFGAADLAVCDPDDPRLGKNGFKGVHQARATLAQEVFLAPDVFELEMPRADIEVDFDLENGMDRWEERVEDDGSISRVRGEQLLYMFSIRVRGAGEQFAPVVTFDDYSNTREGELAVFTDTWALFIDLIEHARSQGKTIAFYHYTKAEHTWMRKLVRKYAGQPGIPSAEEMEDFLGSAMVVDMYDVLNKQTIWPTASYSLKPLAKHIGFSWDIDGTVGGDQSMTWHASACFDEDPDVRASSIAKLRTYGQCDVEAQTVLRDWTTSRTLAPIAAALVPATAS